MSAARLCVVCRRERLFCVCRAPVTTMDLSKPKPKPKPKPKRKRLDTRAAGLRQAARLAWAWSVAASGDASGAPNDAQAQWWAAQDEVLTDFGRELERLAREEEKRGE